VPGGDGADVEGRAGVTYREGPPRRFLRLVRRDGGGGAAGENCLEPGAVMAEKKLKQNLSFELVNLTAEGGTFYFKAIETRL